MPSSDKVIIQGIDMLKKYGYGELMKLAIRHNDFDMMYGVLCLDLYLRVNRAQNGRVVTGTPPELQFTHIMYPDGRIEKCKKQ